MSSKIILFLFSILYSFDFVSAETIKYVSCGNQTGLPYGLPDLIRTIVWIIQIGVPILLILFGSIDLFKVLFISDEKEFSKPIKKLVNRVLAGALVFL